MSKLNAFLLHFTASALVVGTVLVLVWFAWYPKPLFDLVGAWSVIKVLVTVDLVLGPALTLLLYKPGKKHLILDMSVVLVIQLAALVYGVSVIYQERPCYMVFAVDRFEAIPCRAIDQAELAQQTAIPAKLWHEPLYVVANMPDDPLKAQKILEEVVFEGKPDIAERPSLWAPYDAEAFAQIRHKGVLLSQLPERTEDKAVLNAGKALTEKHGADLLLIPLTAANNVISLAIDPTTYKAVDHLSWSVWSDELEQAEAQ